MDAADDEDIKLYQASAAYLTILCDSLPQLLWKRHGTDKEKIRSSMRKKDLDRLLGLIEPFQPEPQLLDAKLRDIIPPLVSASLQSLQDRTTKTFDASSVPLLVALSRTIYVLCKVRGAKVITGFLNNEARWLEPMLSQYEADCVPVALADQQSVSWQEKYVLLLWLSHLILTPFDLSTISTSLSSPGDLKDIPLPPQLPSAAKRIINICQVELGSSMRDRSAALLARLCLRPDMQKIGLLEHILTWALSVFDATRFQPINLPQHLGILSFLSALVTSGSRVEIGMALPKIYSTCQMLMENPTYSTIGSSAVAKKMIIRMLRNIVIMTLHASSDVEASTQLDTMTVLEETIDSLLQSVADRDTPVRFASSKALSRIVLNLDPAMAGDVIEAVIGSLNENVLLEGKTRNVNMVDPLRWHGLALTLAHLLFRRAPSIQQLPGVLNALILTLNFEQRSATGSSLGSNVRDAACFGIWSLSRRYTTDELSQVDTSSVTAVSVESAGMPVVQLIAIELLVTACLDPAGNIRRGSSAALQELIGRHPDVVPSGISLIQVVDFHAVGLRARAMIEVSSNAAKLHETYWQALFRGLLGWRGTGSVDAPSRGHAAVAVGKLSMLQSFDSCMTMIAAIEDKLRSLPSRQVEERHGFILALACIIRESIRSYETRSTTAEQAGQRQRTILHLRILARMWSLFSDILNIPDRQLQSTASRPELTAMAICTLVSELANVSLQVHGGADNALRFSGQSECVLRVLGHCLQRSDDALLDILPLAVERTGRLLLGREREDLTQLWLAALRSDSTYSGNKLKGELVAIAAMYNALDGDEKLQMDILLMLCQWAKSAGDVDMRVVAYRCFNDVLGVLGHQASTHEVSKQAICDTVEAGLNDYTINSRGDVGSQVRVEAVTAMDVIWRNALPLDNVRLERLHAAVIRLSVERLDKVRNRAVQCLRRFDEREIAVSSSTSSYDYFASCLEPLETYTYTKKRGLVEGYMLSAGLGSETLMQASRDALSDKFDQLPTDTGDNSLLSLMDIMLDVLKDSISNERVSLPLLEVLQYLFDVGVLQRLEATDFRWRTLLSLVQKFHFKSTNLQKLLAAVGAYRGLAGISSIRAEAMGKLISMLLHPFPKVRIFVAETLYSITVDEDLKPLDWAQSTKQLKPVVDKLKPRYVVSA